MYEQYVADIVEGVMETPSPSQPSGEDGSDYGSIINSTSSLDLSKGVWSEMSYGQDTPLEVNSPENEVRSKWINSQIKKDRLTATLQRETGEHVNETVKKEMPLYFCPSDEHGNALPPAPGKGRLLMCTKETIGDPFGQTTFLGKLTPPEDPPRSGAYDERETFREQLPADYVGRPASKHSNILNHRNTSFERDQYTVAGAYPTPMQTPGLLPQHSQQHGGRAWANATPFMAPAPSATPFNYQGGVSLQGYGSQHSTSPMPALSHYNPYQSSTPYQDMRSMTATPYSSTSYNQNQLVPYGNPTPTPFNVSAWNAQVAPYALQTYGYGASSEVSSFSGYSPYANILLPATGCTFGVIRITNNPWTVTRQEIIAFLPRSVSLGIHFAETANNPSNYGVHIIMDRSTGKTHEIFVELSSQEDVVKVLRSRDMHRQSHDGKDKQLGNRSVSVEESSQEELMARMFQGARGVIWQQDQPVFNDQGNGFGGYGGPFQGFVTGEELHKLEDMANNPRKKTYCHSSPQRPYESTVSMLQKLPWAHLSSRESQQIFHHCLKMVKALARQLHTPQSNNNNQYTRGRTPNLSIGYGGARGRADSMNSVAVVSAETTPTLASVSLARVSPSIAKAQVIGGVDQRLMDLLVSNVLGCPGFDEQMHAEIAEVLAA